MKFKYDEKLTPNSSFLEEIYYDSDNWRLFVKVGGNLYGYYNVPKSVFEAFKASASLGEYYNKSVKSVYLNISHPIDLDARSGYDWEVTVQVISTIKVKADNVEDAKRLALEGMPDSVVVKEVKISFE